MFLDPRGKLVLDTGPGISKQTYRTLGRTARVAPDTDFAGYPDNKFAGYPADRITGYLAK